MRIVDDQLEAQGRRFDTVAPTPLLDTVQRGVFRSVYRGVPFLKSPFDIGIYLQLLSMQQPKSVVEIGTKHGGSALWFADMLSAAGVDAPVVVSIDINPMAAFTDRRIHFLEGAAQTLGNVLTAAVFDALPRPLLVVDDSSHLYDDALAVLRFFDTVLRPGERIVIEDGVVRHLGDPVYRRYEDGPNRAVSDFLAETGDRYAIDVALCDHYGRNVTYNPNGYLLRRP